MNDQQKTAQIEDRINKDITGEMQIGGGGQAMTIQPQTLTEVMEFAKMMSVAGPMIRKPFRNQPGACLAVVNQALRWGMDPYSVINKAYLVGDGIGYEAQLVHAVVNARAPLQKRLRPSYEGEGHDLVCTISGLLVGEDEPHVYVSPRIADIDVKNSPLWTSDPQQQLWYYSVRAWARRHVPEVIMGVYTEDELRAPRRGPSDARDVTPERPTRDSVREELASEPVDGDAAGGDDTASDEQVLFPLFSSAGEELGEYDDLDWMKTFKAWLETGKMEADFVRNNYEVGALIASGDYIDGMSLRHLILIIADWFEPHEWQDQPEDEGPSEPDASHEEQVAEKAAANPQVEQPGEGDNVSEELAAEREADRQQAEAEAEAVPDNHTMGSREDDDIKQRRDDDFPGDRKDALASPESEQAVPAGNEATGDPASQSVGDDAGAAWPTYSKDGEFLGYQSTPAKFLSGLQDVVEGEVAGNKDGTGMDSWRSNAEGRRQILATKNGALTARLGLIEKIAYGK